MRFIEHNGLLINESYLETLKRAGLDSFGALADYTGGREFKRKSARSVVRIEVPGVVCCGGSKAFYLKRHYEEDGAGKGGLGGFLLGQRGLREDAGNEWEKIILLTELGFPTMIPVAYGVGNNNGTQSLTLTEEIYDSIRVEDYIPGLGKNGREGVLKKREVIRALALLARRFHDTGFNHQDFYLGHFFIRPATAELFMVDLQRVQKREAPQQRWVIKDLSQLAFSALETDNFSRADLVRFGHAYTGRKKFNAEDRKAIKKIMAKAEKIARHTVKLLERRRRAAT